MNATPEITQATEQLAWSLANLISALTTTGESKEPLLLSSLKPTLHSPSPKHTIEPIQIGDTSNVLPEFGRAADVQRIFGIKRGTLYNLLIDGKVKGVLLRVRGQKSGVRLIHLHSVRAYIQQSMETQKEADKYSD